MQKIDRQKLSERFEQSMGMKVGVLGFLFLVLMIPMYLILGLVRERESRQTQVAYEVSSKWGDQQSVIGPILLVPYQNRWTDEKGHARTSKAYFYLLPKSLEITGDITTQTRYRSIYKVLLYENNVTLQGSFSLDPLLEGKINRKDLLLEESALILMISDLKGIRGQMRIRWQDQDLVAKTGIPSFHENPQSGIHAQLPLLQLTQSVPFSIDFQLRGSGGFYMVPVGEHTHATLQSSWPHPDFDGAFLPITRTIGPTGFTAAWDVSYLNRDLPQSWTSKRDDVDNRLQASSFGVTLAQPVNQYSKAERSTKYAGLFIVLTFAVFFLNEVLIGRLFHPVQYLMVGFALSLFYLLLLSLSEFLPFSLSYGIAATMITLLLTAYAQGVFRDHKLTVRLALFFVGLYAFLYVLLQLEDHALLVGSFALFLALSWIMLASRKFDWYHPRSQKG